jgi:hypothetical protein
MITGTYNLLADPSWSLLQLNEVRLECDTTLSAVTINLPEISTLSQSTNLKLVIVDATGNASTNNITVNSFGSDTFDDSTTNQVILDTDGSSIIFQNVTSTQWIATESVGGGQGVSSYKQSFLPTSSINIQSIPQPNLVGEAKELASPIIFNGQPVIRLSNGNLAIVDYIQSILLNGIYIFEAYDLETIDPIDGYWVAFRQNAQNPNLLEQVTDLKMTTQFWNNWYDWTVKDSGDNAVKFVYTNYPGSDSTKLESYITLLTYNNGVLTATDTSFNFGGESVLSLYNSLSGYGLLSGSWTVQRAEYILDDDYYGMALGTEAGWYYYRNTSGPGTQQWDCVGFNVLTGQTRWVETVNEIVANVTNFNFSGVDTNKFIQGWFNHPNGISFHFSDAQLINNGNNVNGVTCVWSPFYENPNVVVYFNGRDNVTGDFIYTGGGMPKYWYWDNENIYCWEIVSQVVFQGQCLIVSRYNTNTKQSKNWIIPNFNEYDLNAGWQGPNWANNNGMLLYLTDPAVLSPVWFGGNYYWYFSNSDNYLSLQSNNAYPTNLLGNKSYSAWSNLQKNIYNLGVEVDEYKDITF